MAPRPLFILLPVTVAGFVTTGILLPSPAPSPTPVPTPNQQSIDADTVTTPQDISPDPSGDEAADVTTKKDKKDKQDKQKKEKKKDKKAAQDTGSGTS